MDRRAYLFDPRRHADASVLRGYTLPGAIAAAVAAHGDAPAVVDGDASLTYVALAVRAESFAAALHDRGIARGSVVGLHLSNGWEFLVAMVAIARLGAVALPLHPPYRAHELQTLLGWAQAEALICPPAAVANAGTSVATVVTSGLEFATLIAAHAGDAPPNVPVAPDDPLSLNPTSGTESLRPKICMHTHDGLLSNSRTLADRAEFTAGDRVLCSSGYTHLFGMACVQMTLLACASLHIMRTFDAAAWLDYCERERITRAWVVPPQLIALLAEQSARPRSLALREIRTGGSAIDPAFAARVRTMLCPQFTIQWGMSEICGGATTIAGTTFARPTLGTPIPDAEMRIVDGELWWRRADMFRGYLGDPATTAAAVTSDGWVCTGDLATLEPDGSLAFGGRTKDVINRGGMKIGAYELEALFAGLAPLRQLAVVAIPDAQLGERTALVCSLHPGRALTLAEATAHLDAQGVAKFKWPERLIVLDELPVTATGKVAKSAVRALVAAIPTEVTL
jgi:acyl-CoA synthetase (AMP-forming)/AMP-acid ligase II